MWTNFLATSMTDSLLTTNSQSRCGCRIISEIPLRNNVSALSLVNLSIYLSIYLSLVTHNAYVNVYNIHKSLYSPDNTPQALLPLHHHH